jgi:hypothetical protein
MNQRSALLLAGTLAVATVASACTHKPEPVALSWSTACSEAWFGAANDTRDVAVSVTLDARERSTQEPTVIEFTVPDARVRIEVRKGRDAATDLCNDALETDYEPPSRQSAVAGRGRIVLDPLPAGSGPPPIGRCGVRGTLHLTGLVAEDGTTFAPIDVTSSSIGCYPG